MLTRLPILTRHVLRRAHRQGAGRRVMRRTRGFTVAALTGCALLAAGCGSSQSGTGATTPSVSASSQGASAVGLPDGLRTESTSIGTVLATSSGLTVYELVGATPSHSACTGSCLSIWPAVKVNGQQVVVNGHPLYRFAGDSSAGQTHGQGLKDQWGKWWALDKAGNPITSGTGSPSTSSGNSGGY